MKLYKSGIQPQDCEFKEAMTKPLTLNYEKINEDFEIEYLDENDQKYTIQYNAGDYLILGKYDQLFGYDKQRFEKEHDLELTEEYKIKRYLANKDNRKGAVSLAKDIEEITRGNWFTVDKLFKKSQAKDKDELNRQIGLLVLMGFCKYWVGDKYTKYKITLDDKSRKELLDSHIKELQEKIEAYQEEKQRIDSEQ